MTRYSNTHEDTDSINLATHPLPFLREFSLKLSFSLHTHTFTCTHNFFLTVFANQPTMNLSKKSLVLLAAIPAVHAFAPNAVRNEPLTSVYGESSMSMSSRQEFISAAVATSAGVLASATILPIQPAEARGRATLEYSCDRYYPRLEAGGTFYANDLRKAIEKNDWNAIKVCFSFSTVFTYLYGSNEYNILNPCLSNYGPCPCHLF